MIVVRLDGGLGNQLFQFAYGVTMQSRLGGRLVFDRRLIDRNPTWANALEQIVDIDPPRPTDPILSMGLRAVAGLAMRISRKLYGPTDDAAHRLSRFGVHHPFSPRHVDLGPPRVPFLYLHGNFMSWKYFAAAADHVRSLIHTDRALGAEAVGMAIRIRSSNSVAVHVRRGDYLSEQWRNKLHICTEEYYRTAVAIIEQGIEAPVFYVFTTSADDTDWVRENYRFLPEGTVFVPPGASDVEHFALMAACRHFIISNSTFSWWASYLSSLSDKMIVAPTPWNRNVWDMSDLYCPEWELIEVDVKRDVD